jgi:hypothetical protein
VKLVNDNIVFEKGDMVRVIDYRKYYIISKKLLEYNGIVLDVKVDGRTPWQMKQCTVFVPGIGKILIIPSKNIKACCKRFIVQYLSSSIKKDITRIKYRAAQKGSITKKSVEYIKEEEALEIIRQKGQTVWATDCISYNE